MTVRRAALACAVLAGLGLASGCRGAGPSAHDPVVAMGTSPAAAASPAAPPPPPATPRGAAQIPGLGPQTLATLPDTTRQVVVVAARDRAATTSLVTEWQRTPTGWVRRRGPLPAHNGYLGWSEHHTAGDGRTPTGTYTLTSAGGELPDPGTRLPYDQQTGYYDVGGTFMGHDLAGSFDYVLSIDYNHVPGSPPSDYRMPLGPDRGQGIWFHVDHGSPTHACVSIAREQMRLLLRWLRPADHPVVVMGPRRDLAQ